MVPVHSSFPLQSTCHPLSDNRVFLLDSSKGEVHARFPTVTYQTNSGRRDHARTFIPYDRSAGHVRVRATGRGRDTKGATALRRTGGLVGSHRVARRCRELSNQLCEQAGGKHFGISDYAMALRTSLLGGASSPGGSLKGRCVVPARDQRQPPPGGSVKGRCASPPRRQRQTPPCIGVPQGGERRAKRLVPRLRPRRR